MSNVTLPVRLAPEYLDQQILPGWQFTLFNVDLGQSSDPEIEKAAIEKIGSYGKQIGHIAEALEIVILHLGMMEKPLPQPQLDALRIFMGDAAAARKLKPQPAARAG